MKHTEVMQAEVPENAIDGATKVDEVIQAEKETRRVIVRETFLHPPVKELKPRSPRNASQPSDLIGQTVGRYQIVRLLGEGGMGAVYLGEHALVNARVAIKVLHSTVDEEANRGLYERFVREARAANAICSPHIVPIIDFGKLEDGRPYAVMECLTGKPLDVFFSESAPLGIAQVADICRQTAVGLHAAHSQGILHRDIKPENLFIEKKPGAEPLVRVLDFGIARLSKSQDDDGSEARLTKVGFVVGTPRFCSPEQAAGRPLTPATDIYSLGAVAYELLTGRPTFDGTPVEILIRKNIDAVRPIRLVRPDIPEAAAELIMQMLDRNPEKRPATMEEVASRFAAFAAARETPAATPGALARTLLSESGATPDPDADPEPSSASRQTTNMPVSLSGATPAAAESKVGGRVSPRRAWLVVGCAAVVGALGTILLFGASATQPPSVSVSDEEAEVAAATEPVASDATQTMAAPTTDIESLPSAAVSVVSTPPARPKSISKVSAPARASTAAASVAAPAKAKATLVDPFE